MSSLIEQAAQRLAQIAEAGIQVPETEVSPPPSGEPKPASPGQAAPVEPEEVALWMQPQAVSKLVELDLPVLLQAGYTVPNAPRSRLADQYRVIKRPLIANALSKSPSSVAHGNLIMLTSALPGEGKSFTAINLAMSIAAEMDHTVMLVDADVARPSLLAKLGLEPAPGLLDLLEGKAEMSNVLLRTNVDKLTILPSGHPHPKATELLASEAMRQLLAAMATRYPDRIIIFDSPPLLPTTEARVLATHMGQIVVVVQAGRTLQADVLHAMSTIESCPVRMMLLNMARSRRGAGYAYGGYGYGRGYGYGYGYGAAEQSKGSEAETVGQAQVDARHAA